MKWTLRNWSRPNSPLGAQRRKLRDPETLESRHMLSGQPVDGTLPQAFSVENHFSELKHHSEAIGWTLPESQGAPDASNEDHYQGVIRYPGAGTPTFYVTQSDSPALGPLLGNGVITNGYLHVVTMGSRDADGERLRSNLQAVGTDSEEQAPPPGDKWHRSIHFNGSDVQFGTDTLRAYNHPGGMAIIDNVLLVAVDTPSGAGYGTEGMILLFDLGEHGDRKLNPLPLKALPLAHEIDNLAVTALDNGTLLIWANGNGGNVIRTYQTSSANLRATNLSLQPFHTWDPDDVDDYDGPAWPTDQGAHQSSTFLSSQARSNGGPSYMIAMRHPNGLPFGGDDFADLYSVDVTDASINNLDHVRLEHVETIQLTCNYDKTGRTCNFAAGSSAYVSPSGELILYGIPHDDVDSANPDFVRMAEFRHQLVTPRRSSAEDAYAIQADAGPNYTVEQGGDVQLIGTARPILATPWVELFEDERGEGRSIVIDYADQHLLELNNLNDLDDFNDKASSARWYLPPGLEVELFEHDNFRGESRILGSGESGGRAVFLDGNISSLRFRGQFARTVPLTLEWDLDGDDVFGESGVNAAAGDEGGPRATVSTANLSAGNHNFALRACDPSGRCDEDFASVQVTNPPTQIELTNPYSFSNPALAGQAIAIAGSFTQRGAIRHRIEVDWGDGSQLETIPVTANATGGEFSLQHSYAIAGAYEPQFTLVEQIPGGRDEVDATASSLVIVQSPTTLPGNAAIDLSFGTTGVVTSDSQIPRGQFVVLPDGSFIVAGTERIDYPTGNPLLPTHTVSHMAATKFHANGTIDTSFGNNGKLVVDFGGGTHTLETNTHSSVEDMALLPSGDIVLVGITIGIRELQGFHNVALAKIDASGQVLMRKEFQRSDDRARPASVIIDATGGIVIAGTKTPDAIYLQKFSTDLVPVMTFGDNSEATAVWIATSFGSHPYVTEIAETTNGYAVFGHATTATGERNSFLSVFDANGPLATSFGADGTVVFAGHDGNFLSPGGIAVQSDGKIVVSVPHTDDALAGPLTATRLNTDGTPDPTFGVNGTAVVPMPANHTYYSGDIAIDQDDKLVFVGGQALRPLNIDRRLNITRLHVDGSLDTSLGTGGTFVSRKLNWGMNVEFASPTQLLVSNIFSVARIDLSPKASITGRKWHDQNENGQFDNGEQIAGARIYVDANHNGAHELDEPYATTRTDGTYEIHGVPQGSHAVRSESAVRYEGDHASFGFALDVTGDKVAVGAPQAERDGRNIGQAYVYHVGLSQRTVLDPGRLSPELDPTDGFGAAVRFDPVYQDSVRVGAPAVGNGAVVSFSLDGVAVDSRRRSLDVPDNAYQYGWNLTTGGTVAGNGVYGDGADHFDEPRIHNLGYQCEVVSGATWLSTSNPLQFAGCLPPRVGATASGILWYADDEQPRGERASLIQAPRAGSAFGDSIHVAHDVLFVSDPLHSEGGGVDNSRGMIQAYRIDPNDPENFHRHPIRISNPELRGKFGISFDTDGEHLYVGNGFNSVAVYHWDRFRTDTFSLREVITRPPGPDVTGLNFGFTVATHASSPYLAVSGVGGLLSEPGEVFMIPKAQYVNLVEGGVSNIDFVRRNHVPTYGNENAKTILDPVSGTYLTVQPEGDVEVKDARVTSPPTSGIPAGVEFPFGVLSFELHNVPVGQTARVAIDFHDTPLTVADVAGYFKKHPTASWYELEDAEVTKPQRNRLRIILTLRDGGEFQGDEDATENGIIVDPGGLAVFDLNTGQVGDLNGDGLTNVDDIDYLCARIHDGTDDNSLDLDGNESIDHSDMQFMIEEVFDTWEGDLNLDGQVSFGDFLILAANFGSAGTWKTGDLDCDGEVSFADFLTLAANFSRTRESSTSEEAS